VVVAQLLTAVGIGVGVLGATVHHDPMALAVLVPALGLMLAGVMALGSSPIVTSAGATGHGGPT
jgi:hypothetical protein